jgi:hypothetical protein
VRLRLQTVIPLLALVSASSGCGEGEITTGYTEDNGWEQFVTLDWSVPDPGDGHWCYRKTIAEDMVVDAFRDFDTGGRIALTMYAGEPTGADGPFQCDFYAAYPRIVAATGVGTAPFEFPDGVGIPVAAGEQVLVNAHLYNPTDGPLSGTSAFELRLAREVDQDAEIVFIPNFNVDIPPQTTGFEDTRDCVLKEAGTIAAFRPQMHMYGRHMSATLNGTTVFDEDWDPDHVDFYPVDLAVNAGDTLHVTCTWDNPTSDTLSFSTDDGNDGCAYDCELCSLGFVRYPAIGESVCFTPGS